MGRKKKWFDLKCHILNIEKINLVSLSNGGDLYKCIHCGKVIVRYLGQGLKVTGECKVTRDYLKNKGINNPENEKNLLRKLLGEDKIINGCWSARIPKCLKCNTEMVLCPEENHPNSKYWELQRNDGMLLYVCPNNCLEN